MVGSRLYPAPIALLAGMVKGEAREDELREASSQRRILEFCNKTERYLGDSYLIVSLWPQKKSSLPRGAIAPLSEDGIINKRELARHLRRVKCIVLPFVLDTPLEEEFARRIIAQLRPPMSSIPILFGVQFLGVDEVPNAETNDLLMHRQTVMYDAGMDQIIIGSYASPEDLLLSLQSVEALWEQFLQEMMLIIQDSEKHECAADTKWWEHLHDLMWVQIIESTMPRFAAIDYDLVHTDKQLGSYRFVGPLAAMPQYVEARDSAGERTVLKVTIKSSVASFRVVEAIYRERLALEAIRHPNVMRLLDMLHSESSVALVYEYAGSETLHSVVEATSHKRLPEKDALDCFVQVSRGLQACHNVDVAHRNLCFRNAAVEVLAASRFRCQIMDFSRAQRCTSKVPCSIGQFPWMAPELALQKEHYPMVADLWSLGVILLELCGGVGSLANSVPFEGKCDDIAVAEKTAVFFQQRGSHEYALQFSGVKLDHVDKVVAVLEMLLQVIPKMRSSVTDTLHFLERPSRELSGAPVPCWDSGQD